MYIVLGKPCSGKGTLSKLLEEITGFKHISAGALLREKYPPGTLERNLLDEGQLVSVHLVNQIMEEAILLHKHKVIIDGFPRTVEQANFLHSFLDAKTKIFLLLAPEDLLFQRLEKRMYCPICERSFSEECLCCGQNSIRRSDDIPDVFRRRLEVYSSPLEKILEILQGPFYFLNADQKVENLASQCVSIMGSYSSK